MTRLRFSLLALALAGCNPNDFGSTLDRAPVQLIERPEDFGSNGGRVLLPLSPPADNPKAAGRLLFAGTENPSLGVADFDGDGKPSVKTASDDDLISIGVTAGITSMVSLSSPGIVALGVAEHVVVPGENVPLGSVAFVRMASDADGKLSFSRATMTMEGRTGLGGHLGLAVARGTITKAEEEVIAVSDLGVGVFTPGGPETASTTCTPAFKPPADLYRSLAVADFRTGGQQEIAVGFPMLHGQGRVAILQYGANPAGTTPAPELYCASFLDPPEPGISAAAGFGTSLLAVPDQDGDGLDELVVGAPPDRAYLFFSMGGMKVFKTSDATSEFGQRVALVDINGNGTPLLGISALQANVGKTLRAGEVSFFELGGDGVTPVAVLFDSNSVANNEFFGIGLAGMQFNSQRICAKGKAAQVPVVGADKGVFAFFRFDDRRQPDDKIADPRCFAR
jgi:hypothetical protein